MSYQAVVSAIFRMFWAYSRARSAAGKSASYHCKSMVLTAIPYKMPGIILWTLEPRVDSRGRGRDRHERHERHGGGSGGGISLAWMLCHE